MKIATTLTLLILVLGSTWFIWFHERGTPGTDGRLAMQGEVCSFDVKSVESISVNGPGGVVVVRRNDDGIWMVQEPYTDRADPEWVLFLLTSASRLQKMATIESSEIGETIGLEEAGLDENNLYELEFSFEEGENLKLEVGKTTPRSRSVTVKDPRSGEESVTLVRTTYIRDPESEDILVVDGDLYPLVSRPVSELRDKKLLRLNPAKLVGLSLKNALGEMELSRNQAGAWELVRPLKARGHLNNIGALLSELNATEIQNGGLTGNAVDVRAFEEGNKSVLTLQSVGADGNSEAPLTIEVSKPVEGEKVALARVSNREPVFKVDAEFFRTLDKSPNELRDDHLAYVNPSEIDRIKVIVSSEDASIQRRGNNWWLERFGKLEDASPNAVQEFFNVLNSEKILEFMADSSANLEQFGLDKPAMGIVLSKIPASGGTAEPDQEPETLRLRIGLSDVDNEVYANYVGEPFVYRIGSRLLLSGFQAPLRWKALRVLPLNNLTEIKRIEISRGKMPPLDIACDFNENRFRAEMAGEDVTEQLDKNQVRDLALTLVGFRAEKWVTNLKSSPPELEDPDLVIRFDMEKLNEAGEPVMVPGELALAPTEKGRITPLYYGRLLSTADVFLIKRPMFLRLLQSPLEAAPVSDKDLEEYINSLREKGMAPGEVEVPPVLPENTDNPTENPVVPDSSEPRGSAPVEPAPVEPAPVEPAPESGGGDGNQLGPEGETGSN